MSKCNINKEDDIYSGLEFAIQKLNHYYDKISPMVGIALILNPSMKKEFLKESLSWKDEWVETVMDHFHSSFNYYKGRVTASTAALITKEPSETYSMPAVLTDFMKRRKISQAESAIESEYARYKPLI